GYGRRLEAERDQCGQRRQHEGGRVHQKCQLLERPIAGCPVAHPPGRGVRARREGIKRDVGHCRLRFAAMRRPAREQSIRRPPAWQRNPRRSHPPKGGSHPPSMVLADPVSRRLRRMTTLESEPARPGRQAPPSLRDQLAAGRAVRKQVPRDALADLVPDGRDPMAILDEQDADRLRELVSIRAERMAANPFAFFRGTAGLMAADLARSPHTGLTVGSCGDAHVSNFGLYASPQRTLVFDLNDFDEAAWAPWEWDLKRLVTSIVIAGQSTSRDDGLVSSAARSAVVTYARGLHNAVKRGPLRRYYDRFDAVAAAAADPESRRALRHAIRNAEKHTGALAAKRLTT